MRCPWCRKATFVVDSREAVGGGYSGIRRRRECRCGRRFTTLEVMAELDASRSIVPIMARRKPIRVLLTVDEHGKVLVSELKK